MTKQALRLLSPRMKSFPPLLVVAATLFAVTGLNAEVTAVTDPVGFMTIDTPQGSDTIIAAPFTKAPVFQGLASSVNSFTVTFNPSPDFGDLTSMPHYVQAATGGKAGVIFDIASNTSNTITLVDNGISPADLANSSVKVIPYWTLGQLYPATDQGVSFTPSGVLGPLRRTQILFPNVLGTGINRSPSTTYYFVTNASTPLDPVVSYWRSTGSGTNNVNNTAILPDSYFIVRNPTNAASGLKTTIVGSVNVGPSVVQLDSTGGSPNDNNVSLGRPVDIKLDELGIIESGAFMQSTSTLGPTRRDQLMIINNDTFGFNKSPSTTYYYVTNQGWKSTATGTNDVGTNIIKSATGYIIRKASQNPVGSTFWTNNITISE